LAENTGTATLSEIEEYKQAIVEHKTCVDCITTYGKHGAPCEDCPIFKRQQEMQKKFVSPWTPKVPWPRKRRPYECPYDDWGYWWEPKPPKVTWIRYDDDYQMPPNPQVVWCDSNPNRELQQSYFGE
jgi:hypothetical protein